jgi:hypothetical protein
VKQGVKPLPQDFHMLRCQTQGSLKVSELPLGAPALLEGFPTIPSAQQGALWFRRSHCDKPWHHEFLLSLSLSHTHTNPPCTSRILWKRMPKSGLQKFHSNCCKKFASIESEPQRNTSIHTSHRECQNLVYRNFIPIVARNLPQLNQNHNEILVYIPVTETRRQTKPSSLHHFYALSVS